MYRVRLRSLIKEDTNIAAFLEELASTISKHFECRVIQFSKISYLVGGKGFVLTTSVGGHETIELGPRVVIPRIMLIIDVVSEDSATLTALAEIVKELAAKYGISVEVAS